MDLCLHSKYTFSARRRRPLPLIISNDTASFKDYITSLLDERMNVERWWYDPDKEKFRSLGVGPVGVSLCSPSVPHVMAWRFNARTIALTFWPSGYRRWSKRKGKVKKNLITFPTLMTVIRQVAAVTTGHRRKALGLDWLRELYTEMTFPTS